MLRSLLTATFCCAALSQVSFAADSTLTVAAPYVRLVPPNAPTSGAFMVIHNDGNADRRLVKAESPVARVVELHTHLAENGVMKMRQVPNIEIKAKSQTELKPGSYHIMLIDLKQPLKADDSVPITLLFDDDSRLQIAAPVRKIPIPGAGEANALPPMAHDTP